MDLRFSAAADKILADTYMGMSVGQISIQRQRPLAFSDALRRAVGSNLDTAQDHVSESVLRGQGQHLDQGRFGPQGARSDCCHRGEHRLSHRHAMPTSASMFPGSSANARSKNPRACAMFSGVNPLFKQSMPWKYKSIASGCSERCARRASASISWAFSVLASLDTISSCISNRSAMGLSNRSAQRWGRFRRPRVER